MPGRFARFANVWLMSGTEVETLCADGRDVMAKDYGQGQDVAPVLDALGAQRWARCGRCGVAGAGPGLGGPPFAGPSGGDAEDPGGYVGVCCGMEAGQPPHLDEGGCGD